MRPRVELLYTRRECSAGERRGVVKENSWKTVDVDIPDSALKRTGEPPSMEYDAKEVMLGSELTGNIPYQLRDVPS